MRKKLVLLSALLFFASYIFGQFSVTGRIRKCASDSALAGISVTMAHSALATVTLDDGSFIFKNIQQGNYSICFSGIGYKIDTLNIFLKSDTAISVCGVRKVDELAGVVVEGKTKIVELQSGKLIYNVANSPIAVGGTAVDALQTTPWVQFDPMSGALSIIGKGAATVLVNNKKINLSGEQLLSFLATIPSRSIQKIEVLRNPSAAYDADAQNGIVNIITKTSKVQGASGSINASYTQGVYASGKIGGDLNLNLGKFDASIGLNTSKGSTYPLQQVYNMYAPGQSLLQDIKARKYSALTGGNLTLNYRLSAKEIIGCQYIGSYDDQKISDRVSNEFYSHSMLDSVMHTKGETKGSESFSTANVYYKKQLDTFGKVLTVDVDYLSSRNNLDRQYRSIYFTNNAEHDLPGVSYGKGKALADIYSGKADLELPYSFGKINLGGKLSFIDNKSNNAIGTIGTADSSKTAISNNYRYAENTQALYFSFDKTVKSFHYQLGVRGEYTQTKGSLPDSNFKVSRDYFQLFPNVLLELTKESNVYSFSFTRSVDRPGYAALNPFKWYLTNFNYVSGNPYLQPSYTSHAELGLDHNGNFTSKLYADDVSNGFDQYPDNLGQGGINYMQRNFLKTQSIGINETYIYVSNNQRFYSVNQVDAYYRQTTADLLNGRKQKNNIVSALFYNQNNLQLNKAGTIKAQSIFWYQLPTLSSVYKIDKLCSLDLGASFLFFNKTLQLSANAKDIFRTYKATGHSTLNGTTMNIFNYLDNRKFSIGVVYNFGKKKNPSIKREGSNADELKRRAQ